LNNIINYLDMAGWDEIRLPGISAEFAHDLKLFNSNDSIAGVSVLVDESMPSFFVDLQKVRDAGTDFLKLLSANKRSQIRRSIKQYELDGEIRLHEAQTSEEALAMLDQLAVLHQLEWTSLGKPGAFANQYLYQFHRDLIRSRFDEKEMQLLHIHNEKMTIGYLYCFVYENRVLFYQCGFNYLADNNYRPGLVSHYFAVLHNAVAGRSIYDFLGGDSAYKSSLSTDSTSIYWVRLIRNKNRLMLEKLVVALKHRMRALIAWARAKLK
jgi:CelD/BcsL family acetyltransferase involved in cellulose biosynthesis